MGDLGHAGRNSCGPVALSPCGLVALRDNVCSPPGRVESCAHNGVCSMVQSQAGSELPDLVRRMQLGQHGLKICPDAQRNHSKISDTFSCFFFMTGAFRPSITAAVLPVRI